MANMAQWTELPKDLLLLIAKTLETQIDYLRFRSVCPSWRSSAPPKPRALLGHFSVSDNPSTCSNNYHVSKRTIYIVELPERTHQNQTPSHQWLIKVEEDVSGRMHLLHPLFNSFFKTLPANFPRVMDLLNTRVLQLGDEYVRQCRTNYSPSNGPLKGTRQFLHIGKVAFMGLSCNNDDDYVLLGPSSSGGLTMFSSRDNQWTAMGDHRLNYVDVTAFHGKFYAIEKRGMTSIIDPCCPSKFTSFKSLRLGDDTKQFLVESSGDLLLVDMNVSAWVRQYWDFKPMDNNCIFSFTVFKLDGQKWEPVKSLGDSVLFLSDYSTFSASASDVSGVQGNCIIFSYGSFMYIEEEDDQSKRSSTYIFDLENDNVKCANEKPEYSKLFWPPPDWVTSMGK
ncbi:F-box protein SKIP23 [Tripterygium wilfordii]|uniref:F-box protein SKIP23 n=1 Tax=Tripterygium wilfordii TaxID=458696 RepID=A0A7J7DXD4_TRIWF|nr:F-box protein SKIP23-like [Tripterygium wilfordii]KAF5751025.1 F-box protein SKIP23 [Tripterygium wilfordii]